MLFRLALIAALLCLVARPVQAATARDLAPCLEAADRPICLLNVAGAEDGGLGLFRDEELAAHPDLLKAAGFTKAETERWRAAQDDSYKMFLGPIDEASGAVSAALALDRAGRPPTEALAPIMALKGVSPTLPPFFAQSQITSPRLLAYWLLIGDDTGRKADRSPSPTLASAVLLAWEEELKRRNGVADVTTGPLGLGMAYRVAGDEAGVDRAIRLDPSRRDDERIVMLVRLDRLEQAAAISRIATIEATEAIFRALLARVDATTEASEAEFAGELDRRFGETITKLRADGRNKEADAIEAELRQLAEEATAEEIESTSDAEIHAMAAEALAEARIELVRAAAAAGRADLARETADAVIAGSSAASPSDLVLSATPDLVAAASPAVATGWLNALEAGLRPYSQDDRDASLALQGRLRAVGVGWRQIGRVDRFEELIARWRPAALADVAAYREASARGQSRQIPVAWVISSLLLDEDRVREARPLLALGPRALLENDIKRGRGVANLDSYLAEATAPGAASSLLISCIGAADLQRDFASSLLCLQRRVELAKTPIEKDSVVSQALGGAALAARVGQSAISRELLTLALTTARGIPAADEDPISLRDFDLIEIAKAELRADGRLPPLAPRAEQ